MAFLRQEYQSGLQFPDPGDLPESRIGPVFPAVQVHFFFLLSHQESPFEGDNVPVIFYDTICLDFFYFKCSCKIFQVYQFIFTEQPEIIIF